MTTTIVSQQPLNCELPPVLVTMYGSPEPEPSGQLIVAGGFTLLSVLPVQLAAPEATLVATQSSGASTYAPPTGTFTRSVADRLPVSPGSQSRISTLLPTWIGSISAR